MTTRPITTPHQLEQLIALLKARALPFTVSIAKGKGRSTDQNRLQRLWCGQVAEQLGDVTPEWVRGYSKLHFGVPILRAEDEVFALAYDETVKPLPYETKLAVMCEPLDLPVTRRMTTDQKTRFLDAMRLHWIGQGVVLTEPTDER
jgi:hypothetical protein